jgi:RNA recognition motif-containing protein
LGYGYVNFYTNEDARKALDECNYSSLTPGGHSFRLMWSIPDPSVRKGLEKNNVFVNNLPSEYTSKKLHDLFSEFGEVEFCSNLFLNVVFYLCRYIQQGFPYIQKIGPVFMVMYNS